MESFSEVKRRELQKRHTGLLEEYTAINNQLGQTIDAGMRVLLKRQLEDKEGEINEVATELARLSSETVTAVLPSSDNKKLRPLEPMPVVNQPAVTPQESGRRQEPPETESPEQEKTLPPWLDWLFNQWFWLYYVFVVIIAILGFVSDIGQILDLTLCAQRWLFVALAFGGGVLIVGFSFLPRFKKRYINWDRVVTAVLTCLVTAAMAYYANQACTNQCPSVELRMVPTLVRPGESADLTAYASDPENDPIVYYWESSLPGLAREGGPYESPQNQYTAPPDSWGKKISITVAVEDLYCGKQSTYKIQTLSVMTLSPDAADAQWVRPKDSMTMLHVPGDSFSMGSSDAERQTALTQCQEFYTDDTCTVARFEDETPVHTVKLDGFWIDQTEVSNAQYALCVAAGACQESRYANNANYNQSDYPVVGVTWDDAANYCMWVGGRLPTEAEWEYAARGVSRSIYPWGDTFSATKANFCDKNCPAAWAAATGDDAYSLTAPVNSFSSGKSWCGAFNIAGNVSEWVLDWFSNYPAESQIHPTGPETGGYKVLRGGSWNNDPVGLRTANRMYPSPSEYSEFIGFRCVASPDPPTN